MDNENDKQQREPDVSDLMASLVLVVKRLWFAEAGSAEEIAAANELAAGLRVLQNE